MIRFRMAKINVAQFAILADCLPQDGLAYSVRFGFQGAAEAKRIANEFSIEFLHSDKIILKLTIVCEYEIQPDDWSKLVENNILTIQKGDLGYFANQTVGTARGIMYCRTEGTDFNSLILPPVDLTKILKEDLVIEF